MFKDKNRLYLSYISFSMEIDTPIFQGQRKQLCEHLISKGYKKEEVLAAIMRVPRHIFLESGFHQHAYQDKAFPIAAGQTISHPSTVAWQSELLEIEKGLKVLEIGTGCGYQAAVLVELGVKLFTIERQKELYRKTKDFLPKLGYQTMFFYGDGYKGLEKFAPFDKIIVTAGAPFIPEDLLSQLKVGGRMVIPVGGADTQKMVLITKTSENDIEQKVLGDFSFVPLLRKKSQ